MHAAPATVDAYLAALPDDARAALEGIRRAILDAAPDAEEAIRYGMPGYKYRGKPLIYFAAAKNHCALYGTREGTVRFPPAEPPSDATVAEFVAGRIASIEAAVAKKRK